jgi:hypothetical protein
VAADTVVLKITFHCPTISRPARKDRLETKADKRLISAQKQIIDSPEYTAIFNLKYQLQNWLAFRSNRSPLGFSTYLISLSMVGKINEKMKEFSKEYRQAGKRFVTVYRQRVDEIKDRLADQFNEADYPTPEYMEAGIWVEWQFMDFAIPDAQKIGEYLWSEQRERAQNIWQTAITEGRDALRETFRELVATLTTCLDTGVDGKKKAFHGKPVIEKLTTYLKYFSEVNFSDDKELERLVEQARGLLEGKDVEAIRADGYLRSSMYQDMRRLGNELETMVTTATRSISFED